MLNLIRAVMFRMFYWVTSVFYVLGAIPLLILPGRGPIMTWIQTYTRTMWFLMHRVGGVEVTVKGKEKLPNGPAIIAAKHQSWGDGFIMFSAVDDLAFVTGDHLEKFPFLGGLLRKMGAIVVDNCGGAYARARLVDDELKKAQSENRRILIYPEGHLAPIGQQYRYKRGVFHMYSAYGCPVVPVATNLGLRWPQQHWRLRPGKAVVEFLDPIEPGLDKESFMSRLEKTIEARSIALLGDERPEGVEIGTTLSDPRN
ncbi:lysophospholipid acyltransferase family protein [Hyphococcus formosus]|uniref:lysophospholipid acyltransferase family protein n=1 Tax=Hyphococcus formosus TaxID=3143534 RepID=UPI00398B386D